MSQTPSGPSKTSGLPYQHMEQIKRLLSLFNLAPANWKMDNRLPSFRDFVLGLRENYDLAVSPEVVNWMSGYPPVYEKGEKKGRVKTLAGLSYEEFSLLKEAFDNLVHIGHEQGGINKYRGKRGDMSEPVLDDNGKVLFQAPHISEFFDPRIKWNVELLTDNTPVYFVSDKDGLADWWQEGMRVKPALKASLEHKKNTETWSEYVPALGANIVITSSGLKEPTGRSNREMSAKVFAQLRPLLQNARLLRTENDVTSEGVPQKVYHLYAFMVDGNGVPYAVQFPVRERTYGGESRLEYYGQRILKMEMPGLSSRIDANAQPISVQPGTSEINIIDALDAVKNKGSRIPEHLRRFLEDIKMNPGNPDILYQAAMLPTAWRNSPFFDLLPWEGGK
jgi:hypothetical protein